MKKSCLLLAFVLFVTGLFAQKNPVKQEKSALKAPIELKTSIDSANYAYGLVIAGNIKRQLGDDFNQDIFMAAVNTSLADENTMLTIDDAGKVVNTYNRMAQAREIEKSKMEGVKFLEENKKRKEVTTTASGLQYEIMKKGSGTVSPKASDKVEVHYHGTLLDKSVFDSSVERNKPSSFAVSAVIKGWTEGLQYMHEGDKFKFYIPANLAYGDNPPPRSKIKPGSTLVFEVELLKILPTANAPAAPDSGIKSATPDNGQKNKGN